MFMLNRALVFVLTSILFTSLAIGQNEPDEKMKKIAAVLDNYFDLEREAIHLHLNKTTFINNETIWYQGYIFNRKTNLPYFTTNIFVLLYDETGSLIQEKLVFASSGIFSNNIVLSPTLKSGKYYIQVYTNWMNNFFENESTITEINIINPSEGMKNYKKLDVNSLDIFVYPEGGNLISGVLNNVGVHVKDCNGNAPQDLEVLFIAKEGEEPKVIKLNQFGYGKFDISPTDSESKVVLNYENKRIEKNLQITSSIGIAIEVNSFSFDHKIALKIKTNKSSSDTFLTKKMNLVIHQDQKFTLYPIAFSLDKLEQIIAINKEELNTGINTIRIIDEDGKQWFERLIYVNSTYTNEIDILKNNRNVDKISYVGYSKTPNALISISTLPHDTKSVDDNNTIIAGLTINPYITTPLKNANYYFTNPTRQKLYELDLVLLNDSNLKYSWDYMKINPPQSIFSFDIGITLKGKIDPSIKNKTFHKAKMLSNKDLIMKMSDVSEEGEYMFENLLLTDSTTVNLLLQKLPNFEDLPVKLTPAIINRKRTFYKPIKDLIKNNCSENFVYENIDLEIPLFDNKSINLKEVIVKAKKKEPLTRSKILSNSFLSGFKIDETLNRGSLINFIEQYGFVVTRSDEYGNPSLRITSRGQNSLNLANPRPVIFIDDRELVFSFDELLLIQMIDIDEIYLDSRKIVPSIRNNLGLIKIYTKTPQNSYPKNGNKNTFLIKDAFSIPPIFKNSDYKNTQSQGFDNYGSISWSPLIMINDKGEFIFDFIDLNKAKYKIILEGITDDGKVIHQEKIVE